MIKRDDVRNALKVIGGHSRFLKDGRYLLCKEVYGDERDEKAGATEMECTDYFEEGVTELFNALEAGQKGKVIMDRVSKRDAQMLVKWWNTHTVYMHEAIGHPNDDLFDVVRR